MALFNVICLMNKNTGCSHRTTSQLTIPDGKAILSLEEIRELPIARYEIVLELM